MKLTENPKFQVNSGDLTPDKKDMSKITKKQEAKVNNRQPSNQEDEINNAYDLQMIDSKVKKNKKMNEKEEKKESKQIKKSSFQKLKKTKKQTKHLNEVKQQVVDPREFQQLKNAYGELMQQNNLLKDQNMILKERLNTFKKMYITDSNPGTVTKLIAKKFSQLDKKFKNTLSDQNKEHGKILKKLERRINSQDNFYISPKRHSVKKRVSRNTERQPKQRFIIMNKLANHNNTKTGISISVNKVNHFIKSQQPRSRTQVVNNLTNLRVKESKKF